MEVYIIYSPLLDRFYVGQTEDLILRLSQHNSGYFKNSYTSKANDWLLHLRISCKDRVQAIKIENHIKRMKSRKYLENLKQFPEMIDALKEKYS